MRFISEVLQHVFDVISANPRKGHGVFDRNPGY